MYLSINFLDDKTNDKPCKNFRIWMVLDQNLV